MNSPQNDVRVPVWAKKPAAQAPAKRRGCFWILAVVFGVTAGAVAGLIGALAGWEWIKPNFSATLVEVALLIAVILLSLWKLPVWQVARSKGLTDEKRFERENEARRTLAQIIAGVFLLAGLYSSVESFNLAREGQLTDRYAKAIEQLGASDPTGRPRLEIRIGGIYALERIANDSARDHRVVMEVLTAYVRDNAPRKIAPAKLSKPIAAPPSAQEEELRVAPDIQAILTVLGRRELKFLQAPIDLRNTDLRGANLAAGLFSGANFSGADLTGANLGGSQLAGANFNYANLTGADFLIANLSGALLYQANCREANFTGTILTGANLNDADLSSAEDLGQERINSAHGNAGTKLPPDFKKPDGWLR